jgi:hypothetical protein
MKEVLLYIVLAMVAYDLSIHLVYLFKKEQFFLERSINFWPEWSGRPYQIFWCLFWGIAFVLLSISLYAD